MTHPMAPDPSPRPMNELTRRICTRVYSDGTAVDIHAFSDEDVAEWRLECSVFRPTCALFVDSVCVAVGGMSAAKCAEISATLRERES